MSSNPIITTTFRTIALHIQYCSIQWKLKVKTFADQKLLGITWTPKENDVTVVVIVEVVLAVGLVVLAVGVVVVLVILVVFI